MAERGRPRSFDRDAALRQAMEVFWAKGYDGTSMADLTAAMGVNPPSLYAAFGCKEALFREAVALYIATDGGRIWAAVDAAPTAQAAIEAMLRTSAEDFTRPGKPRGCLIVLGALNADDANAAVCDELRSLRAGNVETLRRRLVHDAAEGVLPQGPDWRAVAMFYMAVQHGMSVHARDGASRKALLAIAEGAMAAWDRLISPDAPAGPRPGNRARERHPSSSH
ncbi:TetR/AcrR family transcriptional regulator [Reyranella sp. CPCC 100927]|uniref:TetR/AcrR family transcriptional regulator n=1 Tax=Reyranella sp. CPCC 100927 TaxID=2599616 RepID=UPI0011B7A698|nr:TetR/AcrR family transcriptional regulator [Reyranella sp. CPCC 100927]TWT06098.1 TetR/AcrR family transcriptional regulator [Reyranella sp. CPCC 100927]